MQRGLVSVCVATSLALVAVLPGCRQPSVEYQVELPPARDLAAAMAGRYSSADLAAALPEEYLEIHMALVPVQGGGDDGGWLYVEQAEVSALDQPYRQRVYHLVDVPGGVRSDVYTITGDLSGLVRAWEDTARLEELSLDRLEPLEGCSIHLVLAGGEWRGGTIGQACTSSLDGAEHTTSQVALERSRITSWDRGWDAEGDQVWGPVAGPYVFDRLGTDGEPRRHW
jgi:hypothetical protein